MPPKRPAPPIRGFNIALLTPRQLVTNLVRKRIRNFSQVARFGIVSIGTLRHWKIRDYDDPQRENTRIPPIRAQTDR